MLEDTTLTTLRTLAARLNPAGDAWRTQLTDEAAYRYARSAAERAPYTGQYVAVFKHTLIDHDLDRRPALAECAGAAD